MKTPSSLLTSLIAATALFASASVFGAESKTYQVTGPVVEVTDKTIIVQKGDEKWELAKPKSTKGAAGVKVGDKVTVYYQMVATEVEKKK